MAIDHEAALAVAVKNSIRALVFAAEQIGVVACASFQIIIACIAFECVVLAAAIKAVIAITSIQKLAGAAAIAVKYYLADGSGRICVSDGNAHRHFCFITAGQVYIISTSLAARTDEFIISLIADKHVLQHRRPISMPLLGIMRGRPACGPGGFVRLPVLIDLFPGLGLPQGIQGLAVIRRQGKRRECLQSHKSGEILLGRCHATARRPKMDFAFKGLVNTMVFNVANGCMEFIA